jgi:membrane protease YdiL (CAAX protease family)
MAGLPPPPAPTLVPDRPDPRWPVLDVQGSVFWPLALAPFGIVMLAYMLILFFHGGGRGAAALLTLVQQLALAVPVALWVRRRTGSLAALGLRREGWSRRDVGVGIGMGVLTLIASVTVLAITVGIVEQIIGHPYRFPVDDTTQGDWFWAFAVMAVCFAPICEELYFRGFLFQGMRRWTRFAWAGLASGALFAFVHVEPIRFFSLWLTGVLFAELFERRKTLVASMCAHATLNLIAITLAFRAR